MQPIVKFLDAQHDTSILALGVILVGMGLFAPPTGIVSVMVATYGISPVYFAIGIIVGMFIKVLANGKKLLRLIGIAPYTIFTFLAFSLWARGVTGLLQSQILYVVIWLALIAPLTRDTARAIKARRTRGNDDTQVT